MTKRGGVVKTIVYFHGYGSSSKSDKVERLKVRFPDCEVLAFDANIDPVIALGEVGDSIMFKLVSDMHSNDSLVFVGTSLGAWLANEMSNSFGCKAVLVNPCFDPRVSLEKYGVSWGIRQKYLRMAEINSDRKKYFVDMKDEVINHVPLLMHLDVKKVTFVNGVGHRFNGSEWDLVMNAVGEM